VATHESRLDWALQLVWFQHQNTCKQMMDGFDRVERARVKGVPEMWSIAACWGMSRPFFPITTPSSTSWSKAVQGCGISIAIPSLMYEEVGFKKSSGSWILPQITKSCIRFETTVKPNYKFIFHNSENAKWQCTMKPSFLNSSAAINQGALAITVRRKKLLRGWKIILQFLASTQ